MTEPEPSADRAAEELRVRSGVPRERRRLGRWSVEQRGDELAEIGFAGVRLLRAVRAVVRDRDWNTVPARITGLTADHDQLRLDLDLVPPSRCNGC